ncbi:PQQ-dependent sugar dehydrogenase [Xanthomonadaceae bacterium XH05]|nr:PQQ-dependent sugar dehydrogenase [Xanthomonadaceae bacterium XH05]
MKRLLPLCLTAGLAAWPTVSVAGGPTLDDVTFETVATGVPGVVGVRHAGDGSGRLFLILRTGQIRVVDPSGALLPTPFLNIGTGGTAPPLGFHIPSATGGDERGMLGLAFHPEYVSNGKFYIYYLDRNNTSNTNDNNSVVAEYTVSSSDPNVADANSGRVILRVWQPFNNHNGGDIHFGADGYLYIGLGDGGSGNDPCESGQALTPSAVNGCTANATFTGSAPAGVPRGNGDSRALLGKMLRIDVDSTHTPAGADLCGADPSLRTYGIPSDNPFAGDTGSNAASCDEIYHYGLRNPWRFGFDRETHDLIIGDVGQGTWEELDMIPGSARGLNFGWKNCEGFHERGSTTTLCSLAGRTDPIVAYRNPTVGYSIAGGYRYRGPFTALDHVIFSGDYGGKIFGITHDGSTWNIEKTWTSAGSVVGFGEGEDGHLYVAALGGTVRRINLPAQPGDVPELALNIHVDLIDANDNGLADPGDVIELSYDVSNTGNVALTWVKVEDSLGNELPCAPLLHASASASCGQVQRAVVMADMDANELIISAIATGKLPQGSALAVPATAEVSIPTNATGLFSDGFESP